MTLHRLEWWRCKSSLWLPDWMDWKIVPNLVTTKIAAMERTPFLTTSYFGSNEIRSGVRRYLVTAQTWRCCTVSTYISNLSTTPNFIVYYALYPRIVTFKVVKHPQNKLVPLITYGIAVINSYSHPSLSFVLKKSILSTTVRRSRSQVPRVRIVDLQALKVCSVWSWPNLVGKSF